jgi:hypothetical protein
MQWKAFIGASIVVAGALLRYAPLPAIVAGVALAAFLNWIKLRGAAGKSSDSPAIKRR